jgi:hypothetical protein
VTVPATRLHSRDKVSLVTTQTPAPRRARHLLAGLTALALAAVLSGCAVFSPMSTQENYNPGDGVAAGLGDVEVRDLLVVGSQEGEPARVLGFVVNNSDDDVTITISSDGGGEVTVDVPGRSATQVSPEGEEGVVLDTLPVPIGSMVPLTIQVGANPPTQVNAPSVSTEKEMYAPFGPSDG